MRAVFTMIILAGLILAPAMAQETGEKAEEGFRIYYIGNSLTDELKYDAFKNLAATREKNIIWGRHMIPGAPIVWLWDHMESGFRTNFGYPKEAFSKYQWDAITMQPFTDFTREFPAAVNFTKLLMENSPDAQVFIYAQWPNRRSRNWEKSFAGLAETPPDPESKYAEVLKMVQQRGITGYERESLKNRYEMIVHGLNALEITKKPVRLIPVGHVYQLLGQKMDAGLVPGYSSIWEFYSDGVHVSNVGSFIVANTFYATIFGEDPTGLPVIDGYAAQISGADRFEISDELRQVIQEFVWEIVASHPLTGVASNKPV
ncbi:MAG: hypothetical protein ACOC2L_05785, partial [Candidatus Sumerlaeota bacterium]